MVLRAKFVALLLGISIRKWRVTAQPLLHILPTALDHVRQQLLPVRFALQLRIEETEQRAKAFLNPAVRRGSHENQMARAVFGKVAEQLVALMFNPPAPPRVVAPQCVPRRQ